MHRHVMRSAALVCCFILLSLSGCLRYTPSHSELREQHKDTGSANDQLGGVEEFNRYEATLNERLTHLISQRSSLLSHDRAVSGLPLGVGDELQVSVFGFGNLSANSSISSDGAVILPLVGKVAVAGKDVETIQSDLARRYAHFIRSPNVVVEMKTPMTNRVSVVGEVHKPGLYSLTRRGTLLTEVLSLAGGRTPNASGRIVLLPAPKLLESPRPFAGSEPRLSLATSAQIPDTSGVEIDLEDLIGGVNQTPLLIPLVPGDTIIVPEAGNYEVDGEVVRPGSFKLTSRTSVMSAIAAAQGFTYSAAVNSVEVIRDTGGGRKALVTLDLEEVGLRGGRDLRLRSGDVIRVPSEPAKFFKQQIVETINGLFNGVSVNRRMN
jgi:polysaccharide export outer membrane protein